MAVMFILLEVELRSIGNIAYSSMAFGPSLMKIHVKVLRSKDS
jgi:hypothetical protein